MPLFPDDFPDTFSPDAPYGQLQPLTDMMEADRIFVPHQKPKPSTPAMTFVENVSWLARDILYYNQCAGGVIRLLNGPDVGLYLQGLHESYEEEQRHYNLPDLSLSKAKTLLMVLLRAPDWRQNGGTHVTAIHIADPDEETIRGLVSGMWYRVPHAPDRLRELNGQNVKRVGPWAGGISFTTPVVCFSEELKQILAAMTALTALARRSADEFQPMGVTAAAVAVVTAYASENGYDAAVETYAQQLGDERARAAALVGDPDAPDFPDCSDDEEEDEPVTRTPAGP